MINYTKHLGKLYHYNIDGYYILQYGYYILQYGYYILQYGYYIVIINHIIFFLYLF